MRRTVTLVPEALADVAGAYNWYEEREPGLGERFLESLDEAYDRIVTQPELYPQRFGSFRRVLIRRFPYAVYFESDEKSILVYYVFHCSQDPAKLRRRLEGG